MAIFEKLLCKLTLSFIAIYRFCLSPFLGQACRFYPSCSEYSQQAFKQYRFLKASWLTCKRILRCNPLCKGGVDQHLG